MTDVGVFVTVNVEELMALYVDEVVQVRECIQKLTTTYSPTLTATNTSTHTATSSRT